MRKPEWAIREGWCVVMHVQRPVSHICSHCYLRLSGSFHSMSSPHDGLFFPQYSSPWSPFNAEFFVWFGFLACYCLNVHECALAHPRKRMRLLQSRRKYRCKSVKPIGFFFFLNTETQKNKAAKWVFSITNMRATGRVVRSVEKRGRHVFSQDEACQLWQWCQWGF